VVFHVQLVIEAESSPPDIDTIKCPTPPTIALSSKIPNVGRTGPSGTDAKAGGRSIGSVNEGMPGGPDISTEKGQDGTNLKQLLTDLKRNFYQSMGVVTTEAIHIIQNGKCRPEKHHSPGNMSDDDF
jgi:hypothetical protein